MSVEIIKEGKGARRKGGEGDKEGRGAAGEGMKINKRPR